MGVEVALRVRGKRSGLKPSSGQLEQAMTQHEGNELWEAVFSRANLFGALERVQRNGGAAGVDGMGVEELPAHLRAHWPSIRAKLDGGTYQPSPVRRVE